LLTLYIANKNYSSWSLRPWLLLEQLQIPFDEQLVPFGSVADPAGFKAFSPTGRVPCLVHDDLVVWDSLAIVEYIAELNARAWPQASRARAWARSAAAEMHSGFSQIRNICTMNCGLRVRLTEVSPALAGEWSRMDELWQQGLRSFGGPFLGGPHFTAVDAFYAPVVFRVQTYGLPLSDKALAYQQYLLNHPSLQHWYKEALAETWRDVPHDDDCTRYGVVVQDLRAGA